MNLTLVVAMTSDHVIGHEGKIPWKLPEDLNLFRELTWGGVVIMGRNTWSSIGRPLEGRANLVVSQTLPATEGIVVCPTLPYALETAKRLGKQAFIIGGEQIYREALPLANSLVISYVEGNFVGDRHFPELDLEIWGMVRQENYLGFARKFYRRRAEETSN